MPLHCTSARAFQATVRTVRTQITTQRAGEGAGARVGQQAALQPQRARLAQLPGRRGERSGCVRPRRLRHLLRVLGLGARRRLRRRQVCRPAVGRRPCAPRPRRARWSQPASAHGARRQRQLLKLKARPPAAPSADAAAAAPARGGAGAALGPGSGWSRASKRSAVAERRATAGRSSYACAGVRLPPLPLASALRSAVRARTGSIKSPPRARARARQRRRSGHPCEPRAVTGLWQRSACPGAEPPQRAPAPQAAPRKTRLLLRAPQDDARPAAVLPSSPRAGRARCRGSPGDAGSALPPPYPSPPPASPPRSAVPCPGGRPGAPPGSAPCSGCGRRAAGAPAPAPARTRAICAFSALAMS